MGKRAAIAAAANAEKKNKLIKGASQQAATPAATMAATATTKPGWADDDDVPFPRGGGSAITPLERREAQLDARRDFMAEQQQASSGERKAAKRKKEAAASPDAEEDVVMSALNAGDGISRADVLRPADLTVGLRVLGAVSDVSSAKLTMQLPCQLTGAVAADDVSDELHAALASGEVEKAPDLRRLFKVGELLICVVTAPPVPHVDKSRQARPPPAIERATVTTPMAANTANGRLFSTSPPVTVPPCPALTRRAFVFPPCGRALPPSCRCGSLWCRARHSGQRPSRVSAPARSCGRRSSRSRSTGG